MNTFFSRSYCMHTGSFFSLSGEKREKVVAADKLHDASHSSL